jgi:ABC-2 type transport system permease protein
LGFRSQGQLWVAILVGSVTSFSIVGIGLMISCLARTVSEAFIYSNFPLIFLMFFTGAVFPIPPMPIFTIAGRTIGMFDFLPPTHAIIALNKVLTLGAGLKDVAYELCILLILSALYFGIGVWLFNKVRLKRS